MKRHLLPALFAALMMLCGTSIGANAADTTPIQRQISCNNQNDKKSRVNTNIYSI